MSTSSTPSEHDPNGSTRLGTQPRPSEAGSEAHRETVRAREERHYGGVKIGSAFFGWLTATGTAVLLTALLAAAGTAVGVATNTDLGTASNATQSAGTIGLVGGIALLVVLFVAYFCGGYVAGRMARFNGLKQGAAVWLWAVVIAVVLAVLGVVAGTKYNVLASLNSFPGFPSTKEMSPPPESLPCLPSQW